MSLVTKIAFFDVDKTILSVNSATLWVRREMRLGHIGRWTALRGLLWGVLYALGMARMERVIHDAVAMLRGVREREIHDRTIAFFHEEVRSFVRPFARALVAAHKARGDRVYLLTSSSTYLSAEIAEELACDGYLCNRMEVEDGVFTGRIVAPLCYGEGKVEHAKALAESLGVNLADCVYYGDSYSDLPVLLAMGEGVAVNPDPRLRRHAKRHGFRVEDWDRPALSAALPRLP